MGRLINRNPNFWHRLFEISFPLLTWLMVTLPIWLSPFHPAVVAYFLLTFTVYFFYKSLTVTIYSTWSYLKLRKMSQTNWLKLAASNPDYKKIYHAVLITNYRENTDKVKKTLEYLADQDFSTNRMIIALAMEKREGKDAELRANHLIEIFI